MVYLLKIWKIFIFLLKISFVENILEDKMEDLQCTVFCTTAISEKHVCHHTKERTIYFILFLFDGRFADSLGNQ